MEPPQGNVKYLADHEEASSNLIDPLTLLRKTIEEIEAGTMHADKLMIIGISTGEDTFNLSYRNSRLKASEMLTAVEILKVKMLKMMGYS